MGPSAWRAFTGSLCAELDGDVDDIDAVFGYLFSSGSVVLFIFFALTSLPSYTRSPQRIFPFIYRLVFRPLVHSIHIF